MRAAASAEQGCRSHDSLASAESIKLGSTGVCVYLSAHDTSS